MRKRAVSEASIAEGCVPWLQVREIAELLEDQLGLVRGWLMSVPSKVC